jgi:hypothetical protein
VIAVFKTDLSEATVVTLFLSPNINARQPKLRRELKPGARIAAPVSMPPDRKPERDMPSKARILWTIR